MSKELYFLRSSESKIVTDMVKYAHPQSDEDLSIYTDYYGLTSKDLGLYALVNNKIAGAIWTRELHNDRETPVLSMAVSPEFLEENIDVFMMEQFLQEAAASYEQIQVRSNVKELIKFYEDFGFERINNSSTFIKKLEKKEVVRPTDGYDPRRWMD